MALYSILLDVFDIGEVAIDIIKLRDNFAISWKEKHLPLFSIIRTEQHCFAQPQTRQLQHVHKTIEQFIIRLAVADQVLELLSIKWSTVPSDLYKLILVYLLIYTHPEMLSMEDGRWLVKSSDCLEGMFVLER